MSFVLNHIFKGFEYFFNLTSSNDELFEAHFPKDPVARDIYETYYSCYADSILPLSDEVLQSLIRVVDRAKISQEIASRYRKILVDRPYLSGHTVIENEPLLKECLKTQFVFEKELIKLKTLDQYQRYLHSQLKFEIGALRKVAGIRSYFCPRFNPNEREFIQKIQEKVQKNNRLFSLRMSDSSQYKISLKKRETLEKRLKEVIEDLKRPIARGDHRNLDSMQMEELQNLGLLFSTEKEETFIRDRAVSATEDPILSQNARFIILEQPVEMRDRQTRFLWREFLSDPQTIEIFNAVQRDDQFPLNQFRENNISWGHIHLAANIGMESAANALILHENRDINQKNRLRLQEEGRFERTNRRAHFNPIVDLFQNGWSNHRRLTAGVDHHESVLTNRFMIDHILSGRFQKIPQNVTQNIGEYFDAIATNDVADLENGYLGSKSFQQALRIQKFIHENARHLYEENFQSAAIETGMKAKYETNIDFAKLALLTQDIFESYTNWFNQLESFLEKIEDEKNLRKVLGEKRLQELNSFKDLLQEFLEKVIPDEVREVMDERADILQNQPIGVARQQALDGVWSRFREKHSAKEVDEIFEQAIDQIIPWMRRFTPSLVLISASLSSPSAQEKIYNTMSDELAALFNRAIPPFWQNKAKIQLALKEILKGIEPSELQLKVIQALELAESELMKNEFIRSRLARVLF